MTPWQNSFKLVANTLAWKVGHPGCQAPPSSGDSFSTSLEKSMQASLEHEQEFGFFECPSHKVRVFIWPTGTAA